MCLSICLSVRLAGCLPICPCVLCQSVCLFVCLCVNQCSYPSVCLPVCLSLFTPVRLSICLLVLLSFHRLPVCGCLIVCLSCCVCLFVRVSANVFGGALNTPLPNGLVAWLMLQTTILLRRWPGWLLVPLLDKVSCRHRGGLVFVARFPALGRHDKFSTRHLECLRTSRLQSSVTQGVLLLRRLCHGLAVRSSVVWMVGIELEKYSGAYMHALFTQYIPLCTIFIMILLVHLHFGHLMFTNGSFIAHPHYTMGCTRYCTLLIVPSFGSLSSRYYTRFEAEE